MLILSNSIYRYHRRDGLYKLEASDQIPIVHSVHLYVIVFRNKYCLNHSYHMKYTSSTKERERLRFLRKSFE